MSNALRRTIHILGILLLTASASPAQEQPDFEYHVRSEDRDLRALIRHGTSVSPTFHSLVERLARTDIIVYVEERQFTQPRLEGATSFVVASGGVRYLRIGVAPSHDRRRLLAIIAHELQHAVEVGESPEVVDSESMAEAYVRGLGYEKERYQGRRQFESQRAIDAGKRVMQELLNAS